MRAESQEDHSLISKVLAKAEFAVRDNSAFFTNDKNDAKVAVNPCAPAAYQIQSATGICQDFGIVIRIFEYSFNLFSDLYFQR